MDGLRSIQLNVRQLLRFVVRNRTDSNGAHVHTPVSLKTIYTHTVQPKTNSWEIVSTSFLVYTNCLFVCCAKKRFFSVVFKFCVLRVYVSV